MGGEHLFVRWHMPVRRKLWNTYFPCRAWFINQRQGVLMKGTYCVGIVMYLVLLCSGCGSEGSSEGGSSSSIVAASFTVTSVTPASMVHDVVLDTVVTAAFSDNVNASTVIVSLSGNGTAVNGTVTGSGNTITFDPTGKLLPNTVYTVTINRGAQSTAGTALQDDYSWTFTTGSTECIEELTSNAYVPQIAVNANGDAIAVWVQSDGTDWNIYANRYNSGLGWGTAELIEACAGQASDPQVAVDQSGDAIVVWDQINATGLHSIYQNRFDAIGGWGTAQAIESSASQSSAPQVVKSAYNADLIIWKQEDSTNLGIYNILVKVLN